MFNNLLLVLCLVPCGLCIMTLEEIQIFRNSGMIVIDKNETHWTLEHDGVSLSHGFQGDFGNNPNEPSAQNYSFDIPKQAVPATIKGCIRLGAIGMSLSGAPFYNPYTGGGKNAVEGDCRETFDDCSGHPSPNGAYHYHKIPACLYTGDLKDKFLGVAFDGYPIYGPMDSTGKNWTSAELDDCHGHEYNGSYRYRITYDFPYILGCYHGVAVQPGVGGEGVSGDRPPPPPPRQKRSRFDTSERRYRRQDSLLDCAVAANMQWNQMTCYAFCHNPGDGSLDNCTPASNGTTVQPTTRDVTPTTTDVGDTGPPPTFSTTEGETGAAATNVPVLSVLLFPVVTVLNIIR